ncbi:MAG: tRNA preQ1(34) S-adenosylmethionine ribosyltransferase-isomerase QueA [Paracoccaceae bacterium]
MKLSEFDFDLPEELIATRPARPRSSARMLVAAGDGIADRTVTDLPDLLQPGDRLVLNDTKVIPARLQGEREPDGRAVEALLLRVRPDGAWEAMVKPLRKLREGDVLRFGALAARFEGRAGPHGVLRFEAGDLDAALGAAGTMPLPPYIAQRRAPDARDVEDYQTVWATRPGAVAAPTASLHFDAPLLEALRARGVETTHVTLHVGAGTFLPVTVDDVADHVMHAETGEITPQAAAEIAATHAARGRVIPVGTTALRLLETAARDGFGPWEGETDIFITPGFEFRICDGLMTNFHLPRSTLMMLVGALMGMDRVRVIYAHAIAERYRFFSYGDSSLLLPRG